MAAAAIDEAVRNVVAVGADPTRIALLDNFCWGNTDRPGSARLARAAPPRPAATSPSPIGTPFISGKDSLNNEFHAGGRHIVIPPTLLDQRPGPRARRAPLRDDGPEGAGQPPLPRRRDAGTSWAARTTTWSPARTAATVPRVDLDAGAAALRARCTRRSRTGLVRACHDLSEGGLAVAAGRDGLRRRRRRRRDGTDASWPICPTTCCSSANRRRASSSKCCPPTPPRSRSLFARPALLIRLGQTVKEPRLRIAGAQRRMAHLVEPGGAEGSVAEAAALVGRLFNPPAEGASGAG